MIEAGPKDEWVADQVTDDKQQLAQLLAVFEVASQPLTRHLPLSVIGDAYTVAGYFYAVSKDIRRRAENGSKLTAQFVEDYMEALVKGLDRATMATMHLGKQERFIGP